PREREHRARRAPVLRVRRDGGRGDRPPARPAPAAGPGAVRRRDEGRRGLDARPDGRGRRTGAPRERGGAARPGGGAPARPRRRGTGAAAAGEPDHPQRAERAEGASGAEGGEEGEHAAQAPAEGEGSPNGKKKRRRRRRRGGKRDDEGASPAEQNGQMAS